MRYKGESQIDSGAFVAFEDEEGNQYFVPFSEWIKWLWDLKDKGAKNEP